MYRTAQVIASTVLASSLVALGGCATPGSPAAPPPEVVAAPETPTPEPTPEPEPLPTDAGGVIPVDRIEEARAAGLLVYVSPDGDGSGVVVRGDQPFPPAFEEALIRSWTWYTPPPGAKPSEETLGAVAWGEAKEPYMEAQALAAEVDHALIYKGACFGYSPEFNDPYCDRGYYLAYAHANGVVMPERDLEWDDVPKFFSIEKAQAWLQPVLDANPTLNLVIVP